jgi:DNA-binding XRE family transcriptional regulator
LKLDRTKLQRARELLGYGIETTAEKAGVSKNSVLRAEHEEDIRPVTARKIAAALKVEVRDLLPLEQEQLPDFGEAVLTRLQRSPRDEQLHTFYEQIKSLDSQALADRLEQVREQYTRVHAEWKRAAKKDATSQAALSLASQADILSGFTLMVSLQRRIVENPDASSASKQLRELVGAA